MPISPVLATAAILLGATPPAEDTGTRLLRLPDICGNHIAFVYAGDVYRVAATGGTALRLTSHLGNELYPKFSPDCAQIAFSAEYDGTRQVYVIPTSGGAPRQISWYNDVGAMPPRGGTDYRVLDWSPDGRNVLVRVNRLPFDERGGRPYLIPADGGLETPLAIPESGGGMFAPDGKSVVYTPIDRDFRSWKRYRGGRAQEVWTYDLVNNTSQRLTHHPASDHQPMWVGNTIFFASDRGQTLNLWSVSPQGGEPVQRTQFSDFDVMWPSAGADAIVFEQGGYLWRFDPATGSAAKVDIQVTGDFPQALPQWKKAAAYVESFDLSPQGERAVFGARGEIFTVPAKNGEVRNISRTPAEREISVSWSPDGKTIAYLSDATGEYEIYLRAQDGSGEPRRITTDGDTWRFPPAWSPDSTRLAYADKRQRLRIVEVATGATTEVDSSTFEDITDYAWAPDSQWLAYGRSTDTHLSQLFLYSLRSGKSVALAEPTSSAFSPAFDPKGRWLYFLSNRDWNLTFSAHEQNYLYTNATKPYALILAKDGPTPYPNKSDEAGDDSVGKARAERETAPDKGPGPTRIDLDGISGRVVALKVAGGSYQALRAGNDAIYFLSGSPRQQSFELRRLALDADQDKPVAANLNDYRVSLSGDKLLLRQAERYAIVKADASQDFNAGALNLDRMELFVDPRVEWKQEFTDAWRLVRDWFYEPGVHGGIERWNLIRERYGRWLPHVASRADFDYLLQEVAGETNAGHVYVQSSTDMPKVERHASGLLGAEFATHPSGYFRIAKIFAGENWNRDQRSPLTEPGIDVREGHFLLAVDGVDARSVKNPYALLHGKGDVVVSLRVSDNPEGREARDVRVRTLTSEQSLRYADWVASRRALVEKLSGGRIGYIHVPNTAVEGNRELNRGMLAYHEKEALIIDDRYNGGGFIPDRMIELVARQPLNYWKRRGLDPVPTPLVSHEGPKAMLINGLSSSGGDAFPYYFRKLKLGTLIGTRTWGGLIGIAGNPNLADGGTILAANFRFMGTDGKWAVENEGVAPDIEIIDRPELIAAGKDPSIEKAVDVLLAQLPAVRAAPVQAPAPPTHFGE
ncbi:S41 family peptidase [Tahibacter amnicola]|uniref:Tricorn protease homolog n=1 Tax=Tahibacter amnicola TaxID=2976241 RepID=A0ABY6BGU0_9GAMM|nr:S41 family peptidase [Tahibacter amnicola]UXI68533.1 PDZ domain-containing protein [Tahibacter amnicola]